MVERPKLAKDIELVKIFNGLKGTHEFILVAHENQNLQISTRVDKDFKILKPEAKDPVRYADYPLIGSHEFPFPCQINSHIFWPDEERSSVILSYS